MKLAHETYAATLQRSRLHGQVWLTAEEIPDDVDVPPTWLAVLEAADDVVADLLASRWSCVIQRLPPVKNSSGKTFGDPPCSSFQTELPVCFIHLRSNRTI